MSCQRVRLAYEFAIGETQRQTLSGNTCFIVVWWGCWGDSVGVKVALFGSIHKHKLYVTNLGYLGGCFIKSIVAV